MPRIYSFLSLALLVAAASAFGQPVFDASFECGNGTAFEETGPGEYRFALEPDTNHTDRYWFYFAVAGAKGETLTFRMAEIDKTRVPAHWETAVPVASSDGGATWRHIDGPTKVVENEFIFTHTMREDEERIACHFPYSYTRVQEKVAEWAAHPSVTHETIGASVQRRRIDLLRIVEARSEEAIETPRPGIWIVARQHAAEVTGSWVLEGFMEFALSDAAEAEALRRGAAINVIPMLNPDGVALGNCRYNALGVNLNRVWDAPDTESSPEILAAREAIDAWVAAGEPYAILADLHGASGAHPHFAYHAAAEIEPEAAADPAKYHERSERFLRLMQRHALHLNTEKGRSKSPDQSLARQNQMYAHGVLGFTFEAGYNRVEHGPEADQLMTIRHHKAVGRALGLAISEIYEFAPE